MCFSTFVSTSELSATRGKYLPITVKASAYSTFNKLKKFMETHYYTDVVAKDEYYDLFGISNGYEISLLVNTSEGKTYVSITVFSEKKRLTNKSKFKKLYYELSEYLKGE